MLRATFLLSIARYWMVHLMSALQALVLARFFPGGNYGPSFRHRSSHHVATKAGFICKFLFVGTISKSMSLRRICWPDGTLFKFSPQSILSVRSYASACRRAHQKRKKRYLFSTIPFFCFRWGSACVD